jgi:hypothetical protein
MLALVLGCVQNQEASRTQQVLELVREAASEMRMGWYSAAEYSESAPGRVDPHIPATCGNSDNGIVPDELLRAVALRACRIFGLDVAVNHQLDVSALDVQARLDVFDEHRRAGVELRGRVPVDNRMSSQAADEPDSAAALSDQEAARLAAQGYRLHVDDLKRFRLYDGDTFSPSIAYLAGVVSFLSEVTDGEDVDLGGILFEREAVWSPALPSPLDEGIRRMPDQRPGGLLDGRRFFDGAYEVRSRCRVALSCAGQPELLPLERFYPRRLEPPGIIASTRRAASTLLVEGMAWTYGATSVVSEYRLRFRQLRAGVERIHEGSPRSFLLFLPPEFDLAEPFTLELELGPGNYRFNGVRLGACAAVEGNSAEPR